MKRAIVLCTMTALVLVAMAAAVANASGPVVVHLGSGSITSTSLATYGTTWGPPNDYWFDLSAGLKVTIVGLNMGQVPYKGNWGWPPVAGEDGGNAQLWLLDGHGAWSRHDLTSAANAGGTWDAQSTWVGHDQGFRKYLIQNFHWPGWDDHGSSQYNVEPWKGPRLAPGPNTGGNMGTPNPASDKFDLEYTYVPAGADYTASGRHRMYYAASWDEMSLPKPPWPAYKWRWNKAINNMPTPEDAWLPFYNGAWTVPGFCGPANLRMAFQNRGVPQSGYWTISWDDIVVEGTLGDHVGPATSDVVATPNPVELGVPIALAAVVDDSTGGGSTIASAEYKIDAAGWVAMSAQDGAFDEVNEVVSASLPDSLEAGVYSICVRGTDSKCNLGSAECVLLAVYDPAAGFVTGGGWIDSPVNTDYQYMQVGGKASFGFVAKYKKGASVPEGNTEFQFKAGNLNFHSTSYDWLVVTGNNYARFKGSGTINGTGSYTFMLWAGDDDPDTFRIKIWYEDGGTEVIVYDNGPEQTIVGGSIVVHTK